MSDTELRFIEQDDEHMYFEVIYKHEFQGTIYIGKVVPLESQDSVRSIK